jgi:hypothetical protein
VYQTKAPSKESRRKYSKPNRGTANPIFAASIDGLKGPLNIRAVLSKEEAEGVEPFFVGICRLYFPQEVTAYVQGPFDKSRIYTWAENRVVLEEVIASGMHVYQIRRRPMLDAERPRAVSMAELKGKVAEEKPVKGACFTEVTLHTPKPEDPWKEFFDITRLIDVPPEGYPLSGTPIEGLRNILVKRDPGSRNRRWATHKWHELLAEAAEERHARRVLDNELMAEWEAEPEEDPEEETP